MKGARLLILVPVLLALISLPTAAAPQAGPCGPGTTYDPACDVNHDTQITITDIQLTAGHWNQSGTWVSDNQHDHLGQTWTGTNNPLKIQGTFGSPDSAPLVLSNTSGSGLRISSADSDGVRVRSAVNHGMYVGSAGYDGVRVRWAGDVVTAIGLTDAVPGSLERLALVGLARSPAASVIGVVSSRMALQPLPGKDGMEDLRSVDGPAQPGDYVAITVLGVAQVKVQEGAAILRTAIAHRLPVIDLRAVCTHPEDYANPIEPSSVGGAKIARAIAALATEMNPTPVATRIIAG